MVQDTKQLLSFNMVIKKQDRKVKLKKRAMPRFFAFH